MGGVGKASGSKGHVAIVLGDGVGYGGCRPWDGYRLKKSKICIRSINRWGSLSVG